MTDFFINLCCGVILLFIFSPYLEHVGPKTSLTTLYSNSTQTRWCLICCSIRASYDWLAQMTSCQVVINYSCTKFAFAQNFLESRAKIQTDLKPNVAFNSSRISETQPVAKKREEKEKKASLYLSKLNMLCETTFAWMKFVLVSCMVSTFSSSLSWNWRIAFTFRKPILSWTFFCSFWS